MAGISLRDYQLKAVNQMHDGCILCGGVGSGKSRTALAYYYFMMGGELNTDDYVYMAKSPPLDLYIITTARKRDTHEWETEFPQFLFSTGDSKVYNHNIFIDSWNNIQKYKDVTDAFFIFDEQRVVGYGAWSKSFIKIAKHNRWILLSATPGDTWMDYIPVFIANGFYKNKAEFVREHVIYKHAIRYPVVDRYINTGRLVRLRNKILVDMDFNRETVSHDIYINCEYYRDMYKETQKNRWNPYENKPIENVAELCYILRKITNSSETRIESILSIRKEHPRLIIFYNFDYELDILRSADFGSDVEKAEWNGHMHQPIPETDSWVYFVQYNAGAEGWNCIKTDTIIFYSQNYSYKVMQQAKGRIDRLNTPFKDLYYYHLKSKSSIDLAIDKALRNKKKFNESRFVRNIF